MVTAHSDMSQEPVPSLSLYPKAWPDYVVFQFGLYRGMLVMS
jgi:hypothetical protein